jgi:hypothetical protein
MSYRPLWPLLLIGILLIAGGCAAQQAVHTRLDLSSPQAAALTYLRAIAAGDVQTAKAACIGNDDEKAAVEAMSLFITGLRAYDQAVMAKFHQDAVQIDAQLRQAITDLSDAPIQHIEQGIVNEGPDTASVEPAAGGMRLHARPPIYLRKEKNQWKVDLATTQQADRHFEPAVVQQYRAAGKALHLVADRVKIGRYQSLAQAQRDTDANTP